ncbi:hypothetical protein CK203_100345 [Vitis vinifera]|uniref:Uncharacterized protein n=1 Tax=Vitis vinifera TaxID=29760 RepID=A0A438D753_VITVI|nr:hypothetical protein CK203_100345 [Vitis vinifera]
MAASDVTDGPVLSLINKRLRGLRKKYNRITQMEEAIAKANPSTKNRKTFSAPSPPSPSSSTSWRGFASPFPLPLKRNLVSLSKATTYPLSAPQPSSIINKDGADDGEEKPESDHLNVENLLNLLYFGYLFDVKPQTDFTSTMLTRTHERGCCLTYDYVTDDATDLLGERDLDLISQLSGLLISRPVDSSLSHKNALQRCIEHARLWLANSDGQSNRMLLLHKLNKIMASDYFTTTPEMKAPVEVAAAAAAGNYVSFQVPLHSSVVPVQVEGSIAQYSKR